MATDVTNSVEDVEMAEREEDKVVTMMDVLQEQQDFEEDANAVLGASDDKNCTYSKGYIKRQALYACMTCCSEAKTDLSKRAGLCLACSLICHENHELIELYTKRNFRCDCGNSKFNSHPCQLTPNKALQNEENNYNQNFSGLYCVCQRPYPDPENKVDDEMIQCTICEDWLHASHLETTVPASDQYTEMICKGCMEKNVFLYCYSNLAVNSDNTDVDIININASDDKSSNICNGEIKTDRTENRVQSQGNQDIDMCEKNPETLTNEDKIGNNQNIENNINESEITTNRDSKDDDNISCKKQFPHESAEPPTDSPITSHGTAKLDSEIPKLNNDENLQDLNKECNKTEVITEIMKDKTPTGNISEQKTNEDQLMEKLENDGVRESKDYVDNKKVASQELETDLETTVTVMNSKKETEDALSAAEVTISNQSKNEETMEEDRLLADPESEDSNLKSNSDVKKIDDSKILDSIENTSSGEFAVNEKRNIEQDVDNKSLNLQSNNQDTPAKLENELSQDSPAAVSQKATTLGCQEVDNNESKKSEKNNEKTKSKDEAHIDEIINPSTSKEESSNTEQTTSKSKKSEANSLVTEKRKLSTEDEVSTNNVVVKKTKLETSYDNKSCICPKNIRKIHKGATFWPSSFRQKLCTCRECLTLYKDLSVLYLIDPEDTVSAYENLGIEKTNGKPSQYEKGLQALSSLDRIQQINALTEYNKMRDKLLDFLKSFKDRKEIVKEEDIKAFFEGMKPTREPDGVYFCR